MVGWGRQFVLPLQAFIGWDVRAGGTNRFQEQAIRAQHENAAGGQGQP